LRRVFLKADTDHSGQLDITEMYEALRDMGAQVSYEEVAQLMIEMDKDGNCEVDIDEFVDFFTVGD